MKILGVYGASGLGREVLELASIINKRDKRWNEFIFIDDGDVPSIINEIVVYKYSDALKKYGDSLEVVLGIGEPSTREILFNKLKNDNIFTPTLIHPDVYVPQSTTIGKGVVIQYGCFISCNVTIEDYVFLQPQCNIGHDDVLKEGSMISGFGNLGGAVTVGKYSYIGLSAAIKQLISIGDYSVIGMCSMVHRDIDDGMIAVGNPARPMKKNDDKRVFKH